MKAAAIASANLKRMMRERSNIFFVFILPIALILLIGIQFGGGSSPVLGVHATGTGSLTEAVVGRLEDSGAVEVRAYSSRSELVGAVERGAVAAGVFLPEDMEITISLGSLVEVGFVARPGEAGSRLQSVVVAAVAEALEPAGAARFAAGETGHDFEAAMALARNATQALPRVGVAVSSRGEALFPATMGRFDLGASQQLTLFTFITALAGSAALILSRKLGVSRRMLATPTRLSTILVGEGLGRFAVAVFQGLYIIVVTLIVFRVDWGDPLGAALVLVAFSAVGAGAAMLMGAMFTNEQQAGGVAVVASLGLAALGGAMVPVEIFPPSMQRVALATPHAWAIDAFADLVRRDGTIVDVLDEVSILVLYAIVLLTLATWRLRVALTRASG